MMKAISISRYLNPLNEKRWARFKRRKLATFSLIIIVILSFFSFTAEFWASNNPIVIKFHGQYHFPVIFNYKPSDFDQKNSFVVDYKNIKLSGDDFVVWPLIKWGPNETNKNVSEYPSPPDKVNWLGTDNRGRDVLTRLLYGYRYSMTYAFLSWILSVIFSVAFGGIMGYFGGKTDFIGQRLVEILNSVPQFFLLLIVISLFEPGLMWLVFITSLFSWISNSYYVRGEFLKYRNKEFVEAARGIGGGHFRVIFSHILPNSLGPIITFAPFNLAMFITYLASLDYLGFGLTPPTPSWGELLNQAQQYFTVAWWLAVYPSVALFLTLVILAMVGDGVRDAMDPHLIK